MDREPSRNGNEVANGLHGANLPRVAICSVEEAPHERAPRHIGKLLASLPASAVVARVYRSLKVRSDNADALHRGKVPQGGIEGERR